MSQPVPPSTVVSSWRHYYVSIKKGEKQKLRRCLLDDVTGIAPPGHLLAIMGPSGAGAQPSPFVLGLPHLLENCEKGWSMKYQGDKSKQSQSDFKSREEKIEKFSYRPSSNNETKSIRLNYLKRFPFHWSGLSFSAHQNIYCFVT